MFDWRPDTLCWIITGLCNFNCKHCYLESPNKKYQQLSLEDCFAIIDQAKKAGLKKIFITGGEPFVRNDLLEIIKYIYKNDLTISGIESNGSLLNENILKEIPDKNIIWHISYDNYHNHHNFGLDAIKLLKKAGYKTVINSVLSEGDLLFKIYHELKKVGVDAWQVFPPAVIGDYARLDKNVAWQQEGEFYRKLIDLWIIDGKPFDLRLGGVLTKKRAVDDLLPKIKYACSYFRNTITMTPDGVLIPCCRYIACKDVMNNMESVFNRSIAKQIVDSKLRDIKNITMQNMLKIDFNANCRQCELINACQLGCRVDAYLESNDIMHRSQKNCSLMQCFYMKYFYEFDN